MTFISYKDMIDGGYYLCYERKVNGANAVVLGKFNRYLMPEDGDVGELSPAVDYADVDVIEWFVYGDHWYETQEFFKLDYDEVMRHILIHTI